MSSMENKSLTVVIPAYNVGPYIGACLLSVLNQPGQEGSLDIVIVVDGATDNTIEQIHQAIDGRTSNVLLIEQNNAGLSAARNRGLSAVLTEYVCFLDGDDTWLPWYLADILLAVKGERPDIVEYDALRI